MVRHYALLEKDTFPAMVGAFLESILRGEVPAPLDITGQLRSDELSARRGHEANREFSLVSLSVLAGGGTAVTAQDTYSRNWVKISPDGDEFVIEEVS